ncbi:MAG: hypothetical protein OEY36_08305 [Gammaproteobacteria bacterium]|nr:hypothetical protein [Gammaproteobacteria bacterium]
MKYLTIIKSSHLKRAFVLLMMSGLLVLQGCSHYSAKTQGVRAKLESGRPDLALREFEQQSHDNNDKVLTHLHKGMLKRMVGEYQQSNKDFEVAKKEMQDLYTTSITRSVGSAVVNDTVREYAGDRYEQVLIHSYMALNYLAIGQVDSARVEVLQADVKMREWGETPMEDPFVRYLSGIIFEALGEYDQALVSYRKAVNVYKSTINKHGLPVPNQLKQDLLRMLSYEGLRDELQQYESEFGIKFNNADEANKGYLIAILDNGLGPAKSQHTIRTWAPTIRQRLKLALPTYQGRAKPTRAARVSINDQYYDFNTVENIDGMARKALEEEMPAITVRALARMVIKHQASKEAEKRGGGLIGLAFKVGGMVSEVADTRSWSSLPQEIQLIRIPLAAGSYNAQIEIMARGKVIDSMAHAADIKKGRLTFISDHWVAPRPKDLKQAQAAK